jgi:hypothetical protein
VDLNLYFAVEAEAVGSVNGIDKSAKFMAVINLLVP